MNVNHDVNASFLTNNSTKLFNAANIFATPRPCSKAQLVLKEMANGGSNAIIITTAVLLGFSLITICLRCFVRLKIVKSFGSDDVLLVAAAVSTDGKASSN